MPDLGFIHRYIPSNSISPIVLLLLHGTGGDEHDLIPLGQALLPTAAILSVRGRVLENGMPRFFRRLAEGVFDLEDMRVRTNELADFLDAAADNYSFKPEQLVAVGYSNGANIASSLMLTHPAKLRCAILLRAMIPFQPQVAIDLSETSIFISEGLRDPIVSRSNAEGLLKIFNDNGARVDIHWHEGGHELGNDDLEAAKEWLSRVSQRQATNP